MSSQELGHEPSQLAETIENSFLRLFSWHLENITSPEVEVVPRKQVLLRRQ